MLLALLLVGRRRVTEVKPNLVEVRPVPMAIEPEWSEPVIDNRSTTAVVEPVIDSRFTTVVVEPVMQATKSRPGWLSRNKYKVGLGGLMLLSVASRMNHWDTWKSMPRPSFSNLQPRKHAELYPGYYELHGEEGQGNHFALWHLPTI